jgi:hypothetical protein
MSAEEVMDWAGLLLRESAPYLEIPSESGELLLKNKHLTGECKRKN